MPSPRSPQPLHPLGKLALAFDVMLSVGALGGGGALMLGPRGEILPLPMSALGGSPFDTYFAPGLILFGILGLGPLLAAAMIWRQSRLAPLATATVGLALLVWLAVEIAIVGYSNDPPLQPFYLILGVTITLIGARWLALVGRVPFKRGLPGQSSHPVNP